MPFFDKLPYSLCSQGDKLTTAFDILQQAMKIIASNPSYIFQLWLSRGEICVANFRPPCNCCSFGEFYIRKFTWHLLVAFTNLCEADVAIYLRLSLSWFYNRHFGQLFCAFLKNLLFTFFTRCFAKLAHQKKLVFYLNCVLFNNCKLFPQAQMLMPILEHWVLWLLCLIFYR